MSKTSVHPQGITAHILVVPCANVPGKCCPAGDDCFAAGCCDAGYIPCSTSKCYNPSTSKCCNTGEACALGYDCMSGGGCCPSGQQRCGSSKCYDPKTQKCCTSPGQAWGCSLGYDCTEDGGCCPSGQTRCGETKCYDPKTQVCCTSPGEAWGCPSDKQCCAGDGVADCFNPTTEICCSGGSCSRSSTCCGKECCVEGYTCGSDGFCTRKSSIATVTATSSAATATAVTPEICARAGSSCTTKQTITFRYDPNRKVRGKDGKLYDAQNRAVCIPVGRECSIDNVLGPDEYVPGHRKIHPDRLTVHCIDESRPVRTQRQ
jgi:hypothetical protein